jgi:uncharacterized C2H2 Zn-finger protein
MRSKNNKAPVGIRKTSLRNPEPKLAFALNNGRCMEAKKSNNYTAYIYHRRNMTETDPAYHRCPVCGRLFATLGDLSIHLDEAHPEDANNISGTAFPETLSTGL